MAVANHRLGRERVKKDEPPKTPRLDLITVIGVARGYDHHEEDERKKRLQSGKDTAAALHLLWL
jgi:hypothetical protein